MVKPPAPPAPPPLRRRRRGHSLDEPPGQRRAGLIGAAVVHLIVLGLLFLVPEQTWTHSLAPDPDAASNRTFEIELPPEFLAPPAPAEEPLVPPRFVEVNPAAPDNPPDQAPFVGAQNQQVAQPVPTPDGASDTPAVDGTETPDDASALVSGLVTEAPTPSASEILAQAFTPPAPPSLLPERERDPTARETAETTEAARAVNPLPGGENLLGEADGGVGSTVTTVPPVAGAETGAEAVPSTTTGRTGGSGYFSGTPAIDRTRPQDRPRLAASAINARNTRTILNEFGSKNIGLVAYNAKWSSYGEYLQRLIDAVQVQWERLILRSAFYPTPGSTVRVVFKLDSTGMISEVVTVDGTGAELAQRLCVSAITERAPYGEWSEDMRTVLGEEQELTFTFHY